jgi:DnaK suppressor protein
MDVFDQAQANDELFRDAALKEHLAEVKRAASIVKRKLVHAGRSCLDCGKPIPAKRLKANPAAIRCVPCQTKYEQGGLDG